MQDSATAEAGIGAAAVVFVAAHPAARVGRRDVVFEVRWLEEGKAAAIAFTSRARLVDTLGSAQPWIAMPLGRLRELLGSVGVPQLALDPTVPADALRWSSRDIDELVGRNES